MDEAYKLHFIDGVLVRSKLNWDDVHVSPEDDARDLLKIVNAQEQEIKDLRLLVFNLKSIANAMLALTYHHGDGCAGEAIRLNSQLEHWLARSTNILKTVTAQDLGEAKAGRKTK